MTIEASGHVVSISMDGPYVGNVAVTIRLESSRFAEPITIFAKPEEIDMYRVGMLVTLQVRPTLGKSE